MLHRVGNTATGRTCRALCAGAGGRVHGRVIPLATEAEVIDAQRVWTGGPPLEPQSACVEGAVGTASVQVAGGLERRRFVGACQQGARLRLQGTAQVLNT